LPPIVAVTTTRLPALTSTLDLLFAESAHALAGRQAAVNRLVEYLLIQLLRELGEQGEIGSGLLAGLADARLARVLTALHEDPARSWTLAQLADVAALSRARFAAHFLAVMGQTAMDYLTDWRLTRAQKRLLQGQPVKTVAGAVGYTSAAAFVRVFSRRVGQSPAAWAAGRG
ncbi:MAG: AraC family transcriptional regulator, partial [Rhodoferax sp.]